jgi:hypothetical protein
MSIVVPLLFGFLAIGLSTRRMDARAYSLMLLLILVVAAAHLAFR